MAKGIKVEYDMEEVFGGIKEAVKKEVAEELRGEIITELRDEVVATIKDDILHTANAIVKNMVDDFINNEKVVIGNGFFGEKTEEYTLKEYMKKCVADCIKNGEMHIVTGVVKDRHNAYGNMRVETDTIKFSDYLKAELAIGNDVKEYIDKQVYDIRKTINSEIKRTFDESTKTFLSEAVLQVLMSNDTYKKIEGNIACIASKTEA